MWFLTPTFWLLFALLIGLSNVSPLRLQNALLLFANLLFLSSFGWLSAGVCLFSAGFSFLAAYLLSSSTINKRSRHWILLSALLLQALLLTTFKIYAAKGASLPIGLSFYSLFLAGYLLEIHWRRQTLIRSFYDHLLVVSFFPTLPMGPIERMGHLLPQFKNRRRLSFNHGVEGLYWISLGFFKKLTLADGLFKLIDHKESATAELHGWSLIGYCFLCFLQIYADFSGYIDIARGLARLLGIELLKNFNQPYFSLGFSDVWRRWHISLTSWLRDFVFMPVLLKTRNFYLSGLCVLLLTAAWHELSLSYALWALYWILVFEASVYLRKLRLCANIPFTLLERELGRLLTLVFVSLSTLCFIPNRLSAVPGLLNRLVQLRSLDLDALLNKATATSTPLSYAMICFVFMVTVETIEPRCRWQGRGILTLLLVFLIGVFAVSDHQAFIYFRF